MRKIHQKSGENLCREYLILLGSQGKVAASRVNSQCHKTLTPNDFLFEKSPA